MINPIKIVRGFGIYKDMERRIASLPKATFRAQWITQLLGVILITLSQVLDQNIVDESYRTAIAMAGIVISVIMGVMGIIGHLSNPDGTSTTEPYTPPATFIEVLTEKSKETKVKEIIKEKVEEQIAKEEGLK